MKDEKMADWFKVSMTAAVLAATTSCAVVLGSDDGDEPGEPPAPSPSPTVMPLSPSPDVPEDEREAPGTAWPLKVTEQTRLALAEAAREAGADDDATEVETRGTFYYGVVYGRKAKDDDYYVVGAHYWHRTGVGAWRYLGRYEDERCALPVPGKLVMAWIGVPAFGAGSASPCPNRD
ncbi:hypothetical protein ABGB12_20810 [Actinocorallia sp. B10E7]|uniref:hypothetical protein n=1 Tax=Actinocorallia sp. B10E7 TaxID=3153558 RepID=UPI00325CCB1A